MRRKLIPLLIAGLFLASCGMNDAEEFERGERAEQAGNPAAAYWHWRALAERGHAGAQYRIGWMYANAQGLAMDEAGAMRWWRKAAEQGHADASFALAMAYYHGQGVEKDTRVAVHWLAESLRLGVEDAGPILLSMAGTGVDRAETLVRELLKGEGWRAWGGVYRVKADKANVRSGRGTEHELITQLAVGSEVLALHFEEGWVRIGIPGSGVLAWMYRPLLEAVE
jgi:TPR repeat protein